MDKKMKKMISSDIFNDFTELVKKIFSFLENRGFTVEVGKPVAHEISVKYSRPETIIRVHYEIGSRPWVTFTKEKNGKWEDELLKKRFNKSDADFLKSGSPSFLAYSKPMLEKELTIWAKALREALSIG
jgi:hypothetical protein